MDPTTSTQTSYADAGSIPPYVSTMSLPRKDRTVLKRFTALWSVLLMALTLLLTSCGGLDRQIVGVWRGNGETLDFRTDGTVVLRSPLYTTNGYWKAVDDEHVDLQLDGIIGAALTGRWGIQIADDTLTMMHARGDVVRYAKFK